MLLHILERIVFLRAEFDGSAVVIILDQTSYYS